MKYICLAISLLLIFGFSNDANCQDNSSTAKNSNDIKLFVGFTDNANTDLTEGVKSKLKSRIIQLVNQSGVAEVGYSNFLLYPEFYLNSSEVNETGVIKITVVQCELSLFVGRILPGRARVAGGVYASITKKLSGSGNSKEAAINNAITSLRPDDKALTDFLTKAKKSIADYFNTNCEEVLTEADRLYNLEKYDESISLYFSIPSTAPCYETSKKQSIAVYKAFLNNECKSDLVELKSILAMVGNTNETNSNAKYEQALQLFKQINPTTICYEEALVLIKKIEAKFDARQKEEWELTVKKQEDTAEVQKEFAKGMGRVAAQNANPANNIVFIKGGQ